MAWCPTCDRLVDDETIADDGLCPRCGDQIAAPVRQPIPMRFKFMIAATGIYLIWRLYQLIEWLSH